MVLPYLTTTREHEKQQQGAHSRHPCRCSAPLQGPPSTCRTYPDHHLGFPNPSATRGGTRIGWSHVGDRHHDSAAEPTNATLVSRDPSIRQCIGLFMIFALLLVPLLAGSLSQHRREKFTPHSVLVDSGGAWRGNSWTPSTLRVHQTGTPHPNRICSPLTPLPWGCGGSIGIGAGAGAIAPVPIEPQSHPCQRRQQVGKQGQRSTNKTHDQSNWRQSPFFLHCLSTYIRVNTQPR